MKTEEVIREPKPASQLVSRALQDLAPLAAEVLDDRGRKAPLSSAGYVLRSGGKYRLRIHTPKDSDLQDVRVIIPPEFLSVDQPVATRDERGSAVAEVRFRVRHEPGAAVYRLGNVRCDTLEVELQFRPGSGKH